jgi:pimeloyl-ACP methyl ester carboxylesterase
MTNIETADIVSNDIRVDHPRGQLFVRIWQGPQEVASFREKAPIVLFHDSLGCVDLWRDFPARLSAATGRKIIAYDRLGFGQSDPRTDRPALDFVADEATTFFPVLREQLGLRGFIAFGHSVGGGMAVHCAARYPEDCHALVTVAAQVFPEDRTLQGIRAAKEQFKDEAQIDRLRKYHGDKAEWVLDAWTGTWLDPAFASWSIADVLPKVTCPVLAIHGEFDEYGSTRHPEMIGQLSGGPSQVEIMKDTNHVPHRERPEVTLRLVSEFVASSR